MFVHLAIFLLFLTITVYANRSSNSDHSVYANRSSNPAHSVYANRSSNPAHSCYNDGDTETCISYIQTRWKLSPQQLLKDLNRIRQLSGKIPHNSQAIPAPVYYVALYCYAIGQVPVEGSCVPCTKNCAFEFDKDVCGFFCNRPDVQPTSTIQTMPTSTSDRLEVAREAFNTANATLSNLSTNMTRVDTTASTDHSYLMWAGIIVVVVIIIIMVIVVVGGCVLYQYRKRCQKQNEASANRGVAFMWFMCKILSIS